MPFFILDWEMHFVWSVNWNSSRHWTSSSHSFTDHIRCILISMHWLVQAGFLCSWSKNSFYNLPLNFKTLLWPCAQTSTNKESATSLTNIFILIKYLCSNINLRFKINNIALKCNIQCVTIFETYLRHRCSNCNFNFSLK